MNSIEWKAGYDAFHKEAGGTLQYNPYDFGPAHDEWDAGYQAALDAHVAGVTKCRT